MSIDLLPFSAFALESCAAPAAVPGDGQTLTLSLRLGRTTPERMAGRLSLVASQQVTPDVQHVAIAQREAAPLTISFYP
jgi:hypothetical protein